jgi:hypothetical protein
VSKPTGSYPSSKLDTAGTRVVSNAGAVLLAQTATTLGLDHALSVALAGGGDQPRSTTPARSSAISP